MTSTRYTLIVSAMASIIGAVACADDGPADPSRHDAGKDDTDETTASSTSSELDGSTSSGSIADANSSMSSDDASEPIDASLQDVGVPQSLPDANATSLDASPDGGAVSA